MFPIVALGGSAGSLAAIEGFCRNLPARPGVALVVVIHLPPDQPSELEAVVASFTTLPVHRAEDGMRVQPDHVYVIPPGAELTILHGALLVWPAPTVTARRLPIDVFLQSLAKDARDHAVAVIFSGLGTDGALGVKMVMENFGLVMVQDPDTAEFDSMPRAAIATGFADFVLAPTEMPVHLLAYVALPLTERLARAAEADERHPTEHALLKICSLIRALTGHDFSQYKRNTVLRRVERRMNAHQIGLIADYVRYLQQSPHEVELLFKELLIGVTKFFRDPEAFESLRQHLRPLLAAKAPGATVRVWAPGCSTGEEAYSLAILLLEAFEEQGAGNHLHLQLFATDLNPEGVEAARQGAYAENIAADVAPERLERFFQKTDGTYHIRKHVRDSVVFAVHDINKDAPFTRLDLLCCRNLLIYLGAELQKTLLPVFHYALNPGGLLFLGPSETLTGLPELFALLDVKWKIARRSEAPPALGRLSGFPFALARRLTETASLPAAMLAPSPAATAARSPRWCSGCCCARSCRRPSSSMPKAKSSTSTAAPANTSNRRRAWARSTSSRWRAKSWRSRSAAPSTAPYSSAKT